DESNVNTATLVGYRGTAITAIPADGYGEVSVVASGHITKLNARSAEPITAGTAVEITAILSATSVLVVPLI
ncbi:MAG: hypothetical protein L0G99_07030, partial [Propionibacteriales bacterium]|nr:hypothetical protein [Propionibacteriales bacterium]